MKLNYLNIKIPSLVWQQIKIYSLQDLMTKPLSYGIWLVIIKLESQKDIKKVNFQTPWKRIDYIAGVKEQSGIDVSQYGPEDE